MNQQSSVSDTGEAVSSCRCLNCFFPPVRVVWEESVWAADSRRCCAGPVVGEEAWGCGLCHHGHPRGDERHVPECRDQDDQQQRGDTRDHHSQSKKTSCRDFLHVKSSDRLLCCRLLCNQINHFGLWGAISCQLSFCDSFFVKAAQWKLWGDHAESGCADWWTPRWGGIHHRLGERCRAEGPHHQLHVFR